MPLSDQFHRVALDEVRVLREERQRRQFQTEDLEASIAKRGVLSPIIIQRDGTLIAGERRLQACKNLGLPTIPARYADELSQLEVQIIELEENIKRRDLCWQDSTRAISRIHALYVEAAEEEGRGWSHEKTAEELGITQGYCSMCLKVAQVMTADERISGAATIREAYGMIERRQQRLNGATLDDLFAPTEGQTTPSSEATALPLYIHPATLNGGAPHIEPRPLQEGPQPPERTILQRDFREWAAQYSGPKFNLLHCDFPYGVEAFSGPQMNGVGDVRDGRLVRTLGKDIYSDEAAVFEDLFEAFTLRLDRFCSASAHLMFWYTAETLRLGELIRKFAQKSPSWRFQKFPLIWLKSDNAGVAPDARRTPRHTYEVCLLASRGDRQIVQVVGDSYSAPTDSRLHPSCKPEPVLRHFMRMLCDETTLMLDPTCGAGSSVRAAESLGVKGALGLELDADFVLSGQKELREARAKRVAERLLASKRGSLEGSTLDA